MPGITKIIRAEERRDLRDQLGDVEEADDQRIIFEVSSPGRKKTTIYHMRDGRPATVPYYIAEKALSKIDPDTGKYMFTALQENAPEYKMGTVLCFLHADSPDRTVLDEIGLTVPCPKSNLINPHAQRMHGMHKHPQEWQAFQEFIEAAEKREDREAQRAQLDATLAIAAGAAQADPVAVATKPKTQCDSCGVEIEGKLADHTC